MPENILDFLSNPFVSRLIEVLIGFLVISLLVHWLRRWLTSHIRNQRTLSNVGQIIKFLSYLAAVTLVLIIFSAQLPGFTVMLAVAGAGIAFALQEVIVSLAGWTAISFGQFYAIGDRVQLGGIRGDVIQIGVLRTTLMEIGEWVRADQYNGRIVRISNAFVFKEPVFNYSEEISFVWDEIFIPVRYGSDHHLAREIMRKAADAVLGASIEKVTREWDVMRRKYPLEHASVEPRVFLIANDNWMQITLRYPVDAKRRRSVHDELFMYILDAIAETEGRVMLASATFELVAAPALDVRLQSGDKPGELGTANDSNHRIRKRRTVPMELRSYNRLQREAFLHINLWRSTQNVLPIGVGIQPDQHLSDIVLRSTKVAIPSAVKI